MGKVMLQGHIIVPASDIEAIKEELENHRQLTLQEPGCLTFAVTQSDDNPNRFEVYEVFVDRAAFEWHQLRVKNSHWGKVLQNAKRYYDITE